MKENALDIDIVKVYLNSMGQFPLLSKDEENLLLKQFAATSDPEIKQKLINHNLRLVVHIAKKYNSSYFNILDLIQEGNFALIKAVKGFNAEKGFTFATYASTCIEREIIQYMSSNSSMVRTTSGTRALISKVKKFEKEYERIHGANPSNEDIANGLNIPAEKIEALKLDLFTYNVAELDATAGEEEHGRFITFGDKVSIEEEGPEEMGLNALDRYKINQLLDILTPRQKTVIVARFGLEGESPQTLEEIGRSLKVTRERIRQIEIKAIKKMKGSIKMSMLKAELQD